MKADEAKQQYISQMGQALGTQFAALWQDMANLHLKWGEYVILFGTKPSRLEFSTKRPPSFFECFRASYGTTHLCISRG